MLTPLIDEVFMEQMKMRGPHSNLLLCGGGCQKDTGELTERRWNQNEASNPDRCS